MLTIKPLFSGGNDPLVSVEWEDRTVVPQGKREPITISVPKAWSQTAAKVFASHYLRVVKGERETSVRQAINRVSGTIAGWALADGYCDETNARNLRHELAYMMVHQLWSPNSPVWYNVGVVEKPQASACFIQGVQDTMESLCALQTAETQLFRQGSGTGTNLSALRHCGAPLSNGGTASGAASFVRGYDAWAGVTKSGGGTRRAAKMVVLDIGHPDSPQFIREKAQAERMARDLIDAGWPSDYNGPVYANLPFQNANHSLSVPDEFMHAVAADCPWELRALDGSVVSTVNARSLWREVAEAAHTCGDPGLHFTTTINRWHTSPATGRINASNPCCLEGNTSVQTSYGVLSLLELAEMSRKGVKMPSARCFNRQVGEMEWRPIVRAWVAGETNHITIVLTANGVEVRCTIDHHFLTDSGSYVQAQDLKPGTILATNGLRDSVESVDIVSLALPVKVYDIEVEEVHNFAICQSSSESNGHSIFVSNSEYLFLDDSACNLASINLYGLWLRGVRTGSSVAGIDRAEFEHACAISITAQEVIVDRASYPTEAIDRNSHTFRPLGLGYSALGALLMSQGLPYDSDDGRRVCAEITSLMGAAAYRQSQRLADVKGCYRGAFIGDNAEAMTRVLNMHAAAAEGLASASLWREVAEGPTPRNAQATLLAPTGTISFGMDCPTTGIEPDFALVKHKTLAGGGYMRYVNGAVTDALRTLGYSSSDIAAIVAYVDGHEKIEGAPGLKPEHLPVFDCAVPCAQNTASPGVRFLSPMSHLRMMAAAQPFLSGAISKTVNIPHESTVEDMAAIYQTAWTLGLKCVALYRDGCKASQPLSTGEKGGRINHVHPHVTRTRDAIAVALGMPSGSTLDDILSTVANLSKPQPVRRRPPNPRRSTCFKFSVGAHDGYLHVGFYPDGKPCEIFVRMSKQGSTVSGLLDSWATAFSMALQHGAPLEDLCEKGVGTRFDPSGFTGDDLRSATSVVDYICRRLTSMADVVPMIELSSPTAGSIVSSPRQSMSSEGPSCRCGGITRRSGACYVCESCGATSGCG